jgi:hypothetical protein
MAFLTYKKNTDGKTVRYEKLQALKLGGRDGLIAKHVKSLPPGDAPSWKLDAASLLQLAGLTAPDGELTVLFDVAGRDTTNVCLYELSRIHGSSRDTSTQLALDFAVVVDEEIGEEAPVYARKFEIPVPATPRLLGETLALTGGPGGGDWKWAATSLQLGATVVQAKPRHNHGGGEPCPNCSCGRREAQS